MNINKKKIKQFFNSPLSFGLIVGFLAALIQLVYNDNYTYAYGICSICHARDLLNWIIFNIFHIDFGTIDIPNYFPILTTIGILAGSLISSKINKEFKFIFAENLIKQFVLGSAVSVFGLIIFSCPTRLVLRLAFGDPYAIFSFVGVTIGIFVGSLIIKKI